MILRETLSRKTFHKNRTGGVAQGESPEFKPQYPKKQQKKYIPSLPDVSLLL
jgi:hypothetical protein